MRFIEAPTVERLRERVRYDPQTGAFTWMVLATRNFSSTSGSIAGCQLSSGYWQLCIDGCRYKAHRLAWLYVHGEWPAVAIDHINGIRNDNRIANLRLAPNSTNSRNAALRKDNTSGYRGVKKNRGKWQALIRLNNRMVGLGSYATPEEASKAYLRARATHYPEQPIPREHLRGEAR